MYERKVIFANGFIAHNSYGGTTGKELWLYLKGLTFQEVTAIVFDPANLTEIKSYYSTVEGTYDLYKGFTQLLGIIKIDSPVAGEEPTIKVNLTGDNVSVEQRLHD